MSTHHDELERMLGRQLRDQVDGMHETPFGFEDVTGRAGRIRRRRRLAAGAGLVAAVAAVAIIAPVGLVATPGLDGDDDLPPTGSSPVEAVSRTLTLDGLARGEAPAIEYFAPDGVVLPGAGLQELDGSYRALVPDGTDGGWIAVEPDRRGLRYFDEDFQPQGGSSTTGGLATTPDRDWVSWSVPEPGAQTLLARSTTGPEALMVWDFPESPAVTAVGHLAGDRVVFESTDRSGGFVDAGIAEPDGSITELPDLVDVSSANPVNGLVAVQTRTNADASGCFGVIDPELGTSELVWETCDHSLGAFSPDGRYVMAGSPYRDGFGLTTLAVLDASSGEVVTRFTRAGDTPVELVGPVWESDATIVTVAVEERTQTMVRLGVDGTLEEVVDPVEVEHGDLHYYLGEDRTRL